MGERGPRDLLLRGLGAQGALVKLVHPLIVADAERTAADALWSSPFLFFFERRVLPTRHRLFRVRPRNPFRDRKRFLRVPRDDGRRGRRCTGNTIQFRSEADVDIGRGILLRRVIAGERTLGPFAGYCFAGDQQEYPRQAKLRMLTPTGYAGMSLECCSPSLDRAHSAPNLSL